MLRFAIIFGFDARCTFETAEMDKLTERAEWQDLLRHCEKMKSRHLRALFDEDRDLPEEQRRGRQFSLEACGLLLDYSKNLITPKTMEKLVALAVGAGLKDAIEAMFRGEKINVTERRSVLHTALRNRSGGRVTVEDKDGMPGVLGELDRMAAVSSRVRTGQWKGGAGQPHPHARH